MKSDFKPPMASPCQTEMVKEKRQEAKVAKFEISTIKSHHKSQDLKFSQQNNIIVHRAFRKQFCESIKCALAIECGGRKSSPLMMIV